MHLFIPPEETSSFSFSRSSRRSSDQLDLMVDGLPVSLPSYEEAVYGSWGQRIPACSVPGPTQLLLAQEASGCHQSSANNQSDGSPRPLLSGQSPDNPPPPYEEVQSRPRDRMSDEDVRQLHVALLDDKDTWVTDCASCCSLLFPAHELLLFGIENSTELTADLCGVDSADDDGWTTDCRLLCCLHFFWLAAAHQHQDTVLPHAILDDADKLWLASCQVTKDLKKRTFINEMLIVLCNVWMHMTGEEEEEEADGVYVHMCPCCQEKSFVSRMSHYRKKLPCF